VELAIGMSSEPIQHDPARLPLAGVGELVNHAADATRAGMPLDEVFLAIAEDTDHRRLREISGRLAAELARGSDLSTALHAISPGLPAYLQLALNASATGDQAAAVLQSLAEHETTRKRLRRHLASALLYPVIVFTLLMLVSTGLIVFVVAEFETLYTELALDLPERTIFLLNVADWFPWFFGGMAAIPLAYFILWLAPGGRRLAHWVRTGAPMFGRLWIWNGQHEFASILGALVSQRILVVEALACTAASLRDRNVARATRIVARKCDQGMLLSRSLAESMHFDPALPALVAWGEAHDALPEALRQAAAIFEEEIELYSLFLRRILPAILFVSVALLIFGFMGALLSPLLDMLNNFMW
jgi:type II secretory pathway component PulF